MNQDRSMEAFCYGLASGILTTWALCLAFYGPFMHEQGVRDALAGKYVVVQLPDGTSVVVENKEARP